MRQGEVEQKTAARPLEQRAEAQRVERADDPERRLSGAASWQEIKGRFVDDPAGAIAAAEELVRLATEDKIRRLKEGYEELRARGQDEDPKNTELLRTRLIRYQAYCESLAGTTAH